ncbi:MAG TPA: hypothetical protein VGX70_00810, partial [Gemmataceae bacterium]|nr:hypothetical protein [Gemmataceae bacterium]
MSVIAQEMMVSNDLSPRRVRNPSAIFDLGEGQFLFVPSEALWIWHEQAKTLGRGATMSAVWRAVVKAAKKCPTVRRESCASTGPIYEFVTRIKDKHPWVESWVFRVEDAPSNVTVATREHVRWATLVWD